MQILLLYFLQWFDKLPDKLFSLVYNRVGDDPVVVLSCFEVISTDDEVYFKAIAILAYDFITLSVDRHGTGVYLLTEYTRDVSLASV